MKKISIILILFIFLVGSGLGYFFGSNIRLKNKINTVSGETLVGIWQASNGMASGWTERFNFYSNGTFHFYPNEMGCQPEKKQLLGNWEIKEGSLFLTTSKEIITSYKCSTNGSTFKTGEKVNTISKPSSDNYNGAFLGTINNDNYPSILLSGIQYWKFSTDPTSYQQ